MSHSIHPDMYAPHLAKGRPEPRQEHLDSAQNEADIRAAIDYLVGKGMEYKNAQILVGDKGAKQFLAERDKPAE